jgi:hypothetical protein
MTTPIRSQVVLALLAAGAIAVIVAGQPAPAAAASALNPCGCREGAPGTCICEKKSRCGCPGECEPKGCEEKRAKQLEKEIQLETRKAEEAQRRQRVRQEEPEPDDHPSPPSGGYKDRDREGSNRVRDGNDERGADRSPPPRPPRIVKMTPAQKRDLAKLIGAYLAEHPDQGAKAIDQVQSELRK